MNITSLTTSHDTTTLVTYITTSDVTTTLTTLATSAAAAAITPATTGINPTDTLWMLVASALVFFMLPGLGLFYSGFVRSKSALSLLMSVMLPCALVMLQWFAIGYSLVFAESADSTWLGNLGHLFLAHVGARPNAAAPSVPANVFMLFQGMFAAITPAISFGAVAERATLGAFVLLVPLWTTLVYDVIAFWTWNPNGWLHNLGCLDFAGGGPVHIAAGFGALAYAIAVGPRAHPTSQPINMTSVFLGTAILWLGWLGFNGGSGGTLNARTTNAVLVTQLSACAAGTCWTLVEMIVRRTKRMSLSGFCAGAVAGLVAITPACGFVSPAASLLIGAVAALACFVGCRLKSLRVKVRRVGSSQAQAQQQQQQEPAAWLDDTCDAFGVHACGAIVGSLLTGLLAQNEIVTMGGEAPIANGTINRGMQLVYQLVAVLVTAAWSFSVTYVLVKLVDIVPYCDLRLNKRDQQIGADKVELGELAYNRDIDLSDQKSAALVESAHVSHTANRSCCAPSASRSAANKSTVVASPYEMTNRFRNESIRLEAKLESMKATNGSPTSPLQTPLRAPLTDAVATTVVQKQEDCTQQTLQQTQKIPTSQPAI